MTFPNEKITFCAADKLRTSKCKFQVCKGNYFCEVDFFFEVIGSLDILSTYAEHSNGFTNVFIKFDYPLAADSKFLFGAINKVPIRTSLDIRYFVKALLESLTILLGKFILKYRLMAFNVLHVSKYLLLQKKHYRHVSSACVRIFRYH